LVGSLAWAEKIRREVVESIQVVETCVGKCPKAVEEVVSETIGIIADEAILAVVMVTLAIVTFYLWRNRRKY
jgi:hypothetical protein